ncbi:MAG: thioredoxin family protein [Saprospiraceae bacterium]|jgi:thiol-disulfide isomerase/thioredoxin|nr:thioredoxin family protein [Saprospiraceae bacterium]
MKKTLVVIFLLKCSLALFSQGIAFDHDSWQNLLAKAKKDNKIIFVDAYTTWCGPCKMMSKSVFTDSAVGAFYNKNFINAKIDMEKGEGIDLAETYSVQAYPTFLFIDGNGVMQHRSVGYQEPPMFLTLGKTALDEETRIGTMNRRYEEGERKPDFLYRLAYAKYNAMEPDATNIAEEYLKSQSDWNTPDNLDLIYEFSGGLQSSMTKYMLSNKDRFNTRFGQAAMNRKIDFIVNNAASTLKADNPDFESLKATLVSLDASTADQNLLKIKKNHLKRTKNWAEFGNVSVEYFKKYPSNNPQELNASAWDFYMYIDDKKQLEEAVYWALQAIKIDNRYYCNDTAAALYTKLGNKVKAKKYIQKAITLAKSEGADYSETEALKEKLK